MSRREPPHVKARFRNHERVAELERIRPPKPTTTPAAAMRGVVYEDFPGIRLGRVEHAIAQGFALPRIFGRLAGFATSSAALCAEGGEGVAFRFNRRPTGAQ